MGTRKRSHEIFWFTISETSKPTASMLYVRSIVRQHSICRRYILSLLHPAEGHCVHVTRDIMSMSSPFLPNMTCIGVLPEYSSNICIVQVSFLLRPVSIDSLSIFGGHFLAAAFLGCVFSMHWDGISSLLVSGNGIEHIKTLGSRTGLGNASEQATIGLIWGEAFTLSVE